MLIYINVLFFSSCKRNCNIMFYQAFNLQNNGWMSSVYIWNNCSCYVKHIKTWSLTSQNIMLDIFFISRLWMLCPQICVVSIMLKYFIYRQQKVIYNPLQMNLVTYSMVSCIKLASQIILLENVTMLYNALYLCSVHNTTKYCSWHTLFYALHFL